ncbi:MAG: DUF368 domain-containing protein [Bacteroidia bacterium]|nr:DUF368 domain-containing protein [Bacteroidia bacterium]
MQRTLKDYALITLRGLGMGAADVVPGVSGGTIAFISGIYEELINSIKSVDHNAVKTLFKQGPVAFWKHINGSFLAALFLGIGISILSLAKLLSYLMDTYPTLLWGFFFGLIVASAVYVATKIKKWNVTTVVSLVVGIGVAYFITSLTQTQTPEAPWFVFLSGVIAICAMILPGISGSFLLVILGKYKYIINAVKELDLVTLLTFAAGCFVGLISFSHVLSWLFKKYHDLTVALLTGFMVGSLNKVWPWKNTLETYLNSHGEEVPLVQENVLPGGFTEGEPYTLGVIGLAVAGFLLVLVIERLGKQKLSQ